MFKLRTLLVLLKLLCLDEYNLLAIYFYKKERSYFNNITIEQNLQYQQRTFMSVVAVVDRDREREKEGLLVVLLLRCVEVGPES